MPKSAGNQCYVMYFNNKNKTSRGKLRKLKDKDIIDFLKESIRNFKNKYNLKPKAIRMSKEMKDMLDSRQRGISFLDGINLIPEEKFRMGMRTIDIIETKDFSGITREVNIETI